jgi:hypothetical protein
MKAYHRPLHAAVSYVVKVFLYLAIKEVRIVENFAYDAALRRAAGLGSASASSYCRRLPHYTTASWSARRLCRQAPRWTELETAWHPTGAEGFSGCSLAGPPINSANLSSLHPC